jgi:hypothetical protein
LSEPLRRPQWRVRPGFAPEFPYSLSAFFQSAGLSKTQTRVPVKSSQLLICFPAVVPALVGAGEKSADSGQNFAGIANRRTIV